MANAYHKGRIELSEDMLQVLYSCTNCGGCDVSCKWVYDFEPNEVIHELRVKAVESGVGPLPKHKQYIELVERNKNPYGEPSDKRPAWLADDIELDNNSDTIYFVGCTAAYRREEIALSTARVLNHAGEKFKILGSDEFCCGSPVYRVGDRQKAIEIMKHNVELFKNHGVKRIITSCAGCFNMFATEYPRFVETDFEVIHTSQLMEKLLDDDKLKLNAEVPLKVTYHDPCHLGRMSEPYEPYEGEKVEILSQVYMWDPPKPERRGANGVYDAPRNVLKQIPGVKLVEMERIREYSYCCGAGAGCKAAFPEFALFAGKERVEEAESTDADALISTCPFCSTNLQDAIKEKGSKLVFYDLTQIVLKSLEGGE